VTPEEAYKKCYNENKRMPELEDIISTDPRSSFFYARDLIKGPWEEGEKIIINNSLLSYYYARDVIKGPWKKGENTISKHPEWSCYYAIDVIKEPFEKCHNLIFKSNFKNKYIDFLKSINYDYCEWLI
jgi:hypothetical protein